MHRRILWAMRIQLKSLKNHKQIGLLLELSSLVSIKSIKSAPVKTAKNGKEKVIYVSDKLQEIKDDFAWGVKAAGQGQGYTNLDDEQVSWLIEQLEQAQSANQKLVECLEWYADHYTHAKLDTNNFEFAYIEKDKGRRARTVLQEVQHGTSKETDSKS